MSDPGSSPDPLASSLNRVPSARNPLRQTSDNSFTGPSRYAHRNGFFTQESGFLEVSPSKSVVMHTPQANGSSPWKIKVTVEPHQSCDYSDQENYALESPSRRALKHTTTTTTVPLKDAGEHSPVKRRGRPKKYDAAATSNPNRDELRTKIASRPRASTSNNRRNTLDESMSKDVQPKKPRGRPRKSIVQVEDTGVDKDEYQLHEQAADEVVPHANFQDECFEDSVALGDQARAAPAKRGRGRPRMGKITSQPPKAPSTNELHTKTTSSAPTRGLDFANLTPLHLKYPLQPSDSPESINPLRYRVPTPIKPVGRSEDQLSPLSDESPTKTDCFSPVYLGRGGGSKPGRRIASPIQRPSFSRSSCNETPDPATKIPMLDNKNTAGTIAGSGSDESLDDTTILESEGFSMVTIDSLPSQHVSSSTSHSSNSIVVVESEGRPTHIQEPLLLSADDAQNQTQRDSGHQVVDVGCVQTSDRVNRTPSLQIVAPTEPPPLDNVPPLSVGNTSTPKLSRVVKAGIALQGVVKVKPNGTSGSKSSIAARSRLDNLFSGFGEGTRRELQAGLRLGEELARRSQERDLSRESSPVVKSSNLASRDVLNEDSVIPTNRSSSHRLPTPEEPSGSAQLTPAMPPKEDTLFAPSSLLENKVDYPNLSNLVERQQMVTPRAADQVDWEAVTPPSTADSKSNPVVRTQLPLDLDMIDAASDLWEEEASRSSNDDQPAAVREDSGNGSDVLQEPASTDSSVSKPKRSNLPKTWRRNSTSDFHYSDELEPKAELHEGGEHIKKHSGLRRDDVVGGVGAITSSDDQNDESGLFWQHSRPALARKPNPKGSQGRFKKLDLSEILGIHNSPPESSPMQLSNRISPFKNPLPILKPSYDDSPYRPMEFASSPPKQVSFADITSNEAIDDSDINHSACSETSDAQQLRAEMGLYRRKTQADAEPEIFDISNERLTSANQMTIAAGISQPRLNMSASKPFAASASSAPKLEPTQIQTGCAAVSTSAGNGLISRLTGALWAGFTAPPPPSRHYILERYPPVPYLFPWTRTHFISLDNLLQAHKRDPTTFSPKSHPNNAALLSSFANYSKYVGTVYSNWGYSVTMKEEYLVMAKVLMQTMTVKDGAEYEKTTGKKIKIGDCNGRNGKDGVRINEDDIVMRIFAVVSGEMMREDERIGKEIRREGGLEIQWSQ